MYGDYSRGHEPDRKRGRVYRRVLLQQGRPLLDSDVAALVDATLGEVRDVARELGCAAGSPDLGFLATPGRLISIFAEAKLTKTGTVDAWIDYRYRFIGRYPALNLVTGATAATVTLPVIQPLDLVGGPPRAALWARVEDPVPITVNGIALNPVPVSPDEPVRVEFNTGAATLSPLQIGLPAHTSVWLFLLEQDALAGEDPVFSIAPGSYVLDGLVLDAGGGGTFPELSFPSSAGYPWHDSPLAAPPLGGLLAPQPMTAGTRLVAYLEAWERHISAVEDPGIREEALGGTDTTARTQLVGQVKLATLGGLAADTATAAAQACAAFEAVITASGQLTIAVPEATPTTDPCALPDVAGYSGADNRLYRVEVHVGDGLSALLLKWSRDNGSGLFAARLNESRNLVFDAGTPLTEGDIVEVLNDVVDLGDSALASVATAGFTPARRAVGQLAQLAAIPSTDASDEVVFKLVDPDTLGNVALDPMFVTGVKLRRWDGVLKPAGSAGPHVLEDGITITLTAGSYREGDYWQYEARVRGENANGPWRAAPHGPERRFAPLALLRFDAAVEPLRLLAWLDERFSHPCDLDADDVAFMGGRVGSASDTVQEAIEELFERPPEIVDASCGELIIRPENDPQAVFDTIPAGASRRICVHPGIWELKKPIVVQGKGDLIITGNGEATRWSATDDDAVLRFENCGSVRISDMHFEGGHVGAQGDGLAGTIAAIDCHGLDLEAVTVSCDGIHPARCMSAIEVRNDSPPPPPPGVPGFPEVRIRDCHVIVGHAQVGVLLVNPAMVDIEANTISSPVKDVNLKVLLTAPEVRGALASRIIDDVSISATAPAGTHPPPNAAFVITVPGGYLARHPLWGSQFIKFSSPVSLQPSQWEDVFADNGEPGAITNPSATARRLMRRLRRRVVETMFNFGEGVHGAPDLVNALKVIAPTLASQSSFAAGGEGIVIAGRASSVDSNLPRPSVITGDTRPDVRIIGNRILGFAHAIRVGHSRVHLAGIAYRVTIADNLIQLALPGIARTRGGIFAGGVYELRVEHNHIEVRRPAALAPPPLPTDAIRVWGTLGPSVTLSSNHAVGTTRCVFAHATNNGFGHGWQWIAERNTHITSGTAVTEQLEWSTVPH